jgi:hypothetical protein
MAAGGVPFRMEWVAGDVERLHFGSADLDTLPVRSACRAHVAAISSTANRSVRGRLRQVCVMSQIAGLRNCVRGIPKTFGRVLPKGSRSRFPGRVCARRSPTCDRQPSCAKTRLVVHDCEVRMRQQKRQQLICREDGVLQPWPFLKSYIKPQPRRIRLPGANHCASRFCTGIQVGTTVSMMTGPVGRSSVENFLTFFPSTTTTPRTFRESISSASLSCM